MPQQQCANINPSNERECKQHTHTAQQFIL